MVTGTKSLTALLFLAYFCSFTNGACRFEIPKTDVTAFGTSVRFCEYEGLKLLPFSIVKNYEKCEEAKCNKSLFSVCGIGINAGPVDPGENCIVIADGCNPRTISTSPPNCPAP